MITQEYPVILSFAVGFYVINEISRRI